MVTNIMLKGLGKVLDGVADGVAWIQEQPAYIKYILLTLVYSSIRRNIRILQDICWS